MKLTLVELEKHDRENYETWLGPLHPWTPSIDDRTGWSVCTVCEDRGLRWAIQKGTHERYVIPEDPY